MPAAGIKRRCPLSNGKQQVQQCRSCKVVFVLVLLLAGQLCGDTLRAALGYFGGQLGASELAGSSLSQLQVCCGCSCHAALPLAPAAPLSVCKL